jgi:esterase/lipase superfamily enzyme
MSFRATSSYCRRGRQASLRGCFRTGSATAATLILLALLNGCGGRLEGVLVPLTVPPTSSESVVSMLVATSRQPTGDPATLFSGERSTELSLTDIAVSIPPKREAGTVQWPRKLPPDPATDFAVVHATPLDMAGARTWFHNHNRGGRVLVFVHGFNNRYEDSVFRFSQIVHDSGAAVTPILFTWPSRARVVDYNYDKESTNFSRTALEQTLEALVEERGVTEITVMAHSMGTWLAMESLRQMGIRRGGVPAKIKDVMLASPDLDVDVFTRQWNELGNHKPHFTIFVSRDDRALALSRLISGGVQRVGAINPAEEPYRSRLEKAGIVAIDLTKVKSGDRLHHGKFAESPQIVQAIGSRLMNGQTLTDERIGLGDRIGTAVGGTIGTVGVIAGTAVSAPVKVIEGQPLYEPPGGARPAGKDRAGARDETAYGQDH